MTPNYLFFQIKKKIDLYIYYKTEVSYYYYYYYYYYYLFI